MRFNKKVTLILSQFALLFGVSYQSNGVLQEVVFHKQENVRLASKNSVTEDKSYSKATLDDDFTPDRVLVSLKQNVSDITGIKQPLIKTIFNGIAYDKIEDITKIDENALNAHILKNHAKQNGFTQILSVSLTEKTKENVLSVIKQLEKIDCVKSAEPNYIVNYDPIDEVVMDDVKHNTDDEIPQYTSAPNDPKANELWGLFGENGINVHNAWGVTTGSSSVRVGVIDTGIYHHSDLLDNLDTGIDFVNDNNITDDDIVGHGTHVAGTIGAVGDNSLGITGVAQNIRLVPLQCSYDKKGHFRVDSGVVDAINYATQKWGTSEQISVLNYSVSLFGESETVLNAVKNFPGVFVWSAGNDNKNVDLFQKIESFDLNNLISVGAIDKSGNKCSFSNYGSHVSVYAPGSEIVSTYNNNAYKLLDGTSMAAPHVSGVAALLYSLNPTMPASQIKDAIINGGDSITITEPGGNTREVKRLNATNAIAYAENAPKPMELSVDTDSSNSKWRIKIKNTNNRDVVVTYNERMCFADDAKNFYHLTNLRSFKLSPYGDRTVNISEFGTATHIAVGVDHVCSNGAHLTKVTYADGLSVNGMNSPTYYTVAGGGSLNADEIPNYLRFEVTAKYGSEWEVKLHNDNSWNISVTYNTKMCFDDAARNFYGLRDLADLTISANSFAIVRIQENMFAQYITAAINYQCDGIRYRRISSANELTNNSIGTVRQHEVVVSSIFPEVASKPNYLDMIPYSKSGFIWYTWGIKITNKNNFTVQVSYNAKLCFENDAKNLENIADIVTITIPAYSSKNVTINHNGTAGWIVASIDFSYQGYEYRRISYADGLASNPYRTNSINHNEIRYV